MARPRIASLAVLLLILPQLLAPKVLPCLASKEPTKRTAVATTSGFEEEPLTAKKVLHEAIGDLIERSGGSGSLSCAIVLGGTCGSLLWIPGAPRIEVSGIELKGWKAPLAGAAFGLYSVQLPEGDALSGRYRQLCVWSARQCHRLWDARA
eukprot:s577_g14.t1